MFILYVLLALIAMILVVAAIMSKAFTISVEKMQLKYMNQNFINLKRILETL